MTAQIRPAELADIPALTALYNELGVATTASYDLAEVSEAERTAWLQEHQEHGWPVLVAELDGRVVGYGAYGRFREKAGYDTTVEHSVYVAADTQGTGVGRALMDALIAHARQAGVHLMLGGVDAANQASIDFHHRLGFVDSGVIHEVGRKFDRWLDVAFLVKVLD